MNPHRYEIGFALCTVPHDHLCSSTSYDHCQNISGVSMRIPATLSIAVGSIRNIFNSKRHIFSHTNIWSHWTISLKSKINTQIILNQISASISLGTRGLPPCQQHPVGEEISKASRHPLELEVKICNGTENFSYPGQVIPDADKAARLILFMVEEWCEVSSLIGPNPTLCWK